MEKIVFFVPNCTLLRLYLFCSYFGRVLELDPLVWHKLLLNTLFPELGIKHQNNLKCWKYYPNDNKNKIENI